MSTKPDALLAWKLRQLIDELFELSRVGIQANPPAEVAFGELVRDALTRLADRVAERGGGDFRIVEPALLIGLGIKRSSRRDEMSATPAVACEGFDSR